MGNARKACLYSFIAFLSVSALLAVSCVLVGKFGDFEAKVLITTSVIAAASIGALCCTVYSARAQNLAPGTAGILLAVAAAIMVIVGVWSHAQSPHYWKTTTVISVFAVAIAHCLALLAIRIPAAQSWLRWLTAGNIFLLAVVVASMIVAEPHDDRVLRFAAVLAILAALETLVIPILSWVGKPVARKTIVLMERDDGTYCDKDGRVYRVSEVLEQRAETARLPVVPDAGV
jgi:hypothetical protein